MKRKGVKTVAAFGTVALMGLALAACATSKGSTLATVISAQEPPRQASSPEKPGKPPEHKPELTKGLEIDTEPADAQVWIDGDFKGVTPYIAAEITAGWHRIVIRKQGYYEISTWIEYRDPTMVYKVDLEQIVGFLQISVIPEDSIVTVDGSRVSQGMIQLPVGSRTVLVRAFGFTDSRQEIQIVENSVTALDVTLDPAAFEVIAFALPKPAINPENPGVIGLLTYDVSVTGPGTGVIRVADAAGSEVYARSLPDFTTWDQSFTWDVRDTSGRVLPDGDYAMTLTAIGGGSDVSLTKDAALTVDRSLKVMPRSLWSGSAGLLYAPVAEVLPRGDFQVALLGAGIALADPSMLQVPLLLGARIGAGNGLEVDVSAGAIINSVTAPLLGSVAARWNLVSPHGDVGTGMAVQLKLSGQMNPLPEAIDVLLSDTFANFTGISLEFPFQLTLANLSLMLSAGATGSLWYPYRKDEGELPVRGAVTWLYLRAGAMLDLGSVVAGVSASTRTEPLPGGISFLSSPIPFEAGAEIHWLLPGTRVLVSGIFAGEYQDPENYYFMGGAGLGFLY